MSAADSFKVKSTGIWAIRPDGTWAVGGNDCGAVINTCALLPYALEDSGHRWVKLDVTAFSATSTQSEQLTYTNNGQPTGEVQNSTATFTYNFPALSGVVDMSAVDLRAFAQGTYTKTSTVDDSGATRNYTTGSGTSYYTIHKHTTYNESGVIVLTGISATEGTWVPKDHDFDHLGREGAKDAVAVTLTFTIIKTTSSTAQTCTGLVALDQSGSAWAPQDFSQNKTTSATVGWSAGGTAPSLYTFGVTASSSTDTGQQPANGWPDGFVSVYLSGVIPPTGYATLTGAKAVPFITDMPLEAVMPSGWTPANNTVVQPYATTVTTGSVSAAAGSHNSVGKAAVYPYEPDAKTSLGFTLRPVGGPLDGSSDLKRFTFLTPTQATDPLPKEYLPGTLVRLSNGNYYITQSCSNTFDCATDLDWNGSGLPGGNYGSGSASHARWALTIDDTGTLYYAYEAVAVGDRVVVGWWNGLPRCGTVTRVEVAQETGSVLPDYLNGVAVNKAWKVPADWKGCDGYVVAKPCNSNFPSVWANAGAQLPMVAASGSGSTVQDYTASPIVTKAFVNLTTPAGTYSVVKIPGTEPQGGPFWEITTAPYNGAALTPPADTNLAHAIELPPEWQAVLTAYNNADALLKSAATKLKTFQDALAAAPFPSQSVWLASHPGSTSQDYQTAHLAYLQSLNNTGAYAAAVAYADPSTGGQVIVNNADTAWTTKRNTDFPHGGTTCPTCPDARPPTIQGAACDGSLTVDFQWSSTPTGTWGTASPAPTGSYYFHRDAVAEDTMMGTPGTPGFDGCLTLGSPQPPTITYTTDWMGTQLDADTRADIATLTGGTKYADCPTCTTANAPVQVLAVSCAAQAGSGGPGGPGGDPVEFFHTIRDAGQPGFVPPAVGTTYNTSSYWDWNTNQQVGYQGTVKITAINPGSGDTTKNPWYPGEWNTQPSVVSATYDITLTADDTTQTVSNGSTARAIGARLRTAGRYAPACATVTASATILCAASTATDWNVDTYGSGCGIIPALRITTRTCATSTTKTYYLQEGGRYGSSTSGTYPATIPRVGDGYRTGDTDPPATPGPAGLVPQNEIIQAVDILDSSFTWPSGGRAWEDTATASTTHLLTNPPAAETPIADAHASFMAYYAAQVKLWTDQYNGADAATILADQADLAAKQAAYGPLKAAAVQAAQTADTCAGGGLIKITAAPLDTAISPSDYWADPLSDDHIPEVDDIYLQVIPNANDGTDAPATVPGSAAVKVTAVSARGQGNRGMAHWAPTVGPYLDDPTDGSVVDPKTATEKVPYVRVEVASCNGIIYHQRYLFLDTTLDPVPVVGRVYKAPVISSNFGATNPNATGIPVRITAVDQALGVSSYGRLWASFNASYGFKDCAEACPACSVAEGCNKAIAIFKQTSYPFRDPVMGPLSGADVGDAFWFDPTAAEVHPGDCYLRQAYSATVVTRTQQSQGMGNWLSSSAPPPPPALPANTTTTTNNANGSTTTKTTTYTRENLTNNFSTLPGSSPPRTGGSYFWTQVATAVSSTTAATVPESCSEVRYGEGNQSTTPIPATGLPPLPALATYMAKTVGWYTVNLQGHDRAFSGWWYPTAHAPDTGQAPKVGDIYSLSSRPSGALSTDNGPWCASITAVNHQCGAEPTTPTLASLGTLSPTCQSA